VTIRSTKLAIADSQGEIQGPDYLREHNHTGSMIDCCALRAEESLTKPTTDSRQQATNATN
jgi:hypothetical protein